MDQLSPKIVSIRYRANARTSYLKDAIYNGIHIRESDSAVIMSLSKLEARKHFTIDIGHIDTIWYRGKTRKLKSPGSQRKYREAEIKHLLDARKLEDWTDPYLREYQLEGAMPLRSLWRWLVKLVVRVSAFGLLSLPVVGFFFGTAVLLYVAWVMMHAK